ncbi:methyl-accepting chemotaxis protein [Mesorhizobium sp. SP-1A]|uniref:methyl-accepting chemotaxis protein n=1 Tax=Mesorhizobium sp. SP-1A TaxID=3077840 RepID=UPI0028F723B4|nr:methyl-accepting chemotaxis protein [Mesorhizobium sp. SP-1A]
MATEISSSSRASEEGGDFIRLETRSRIPWYRSLFAKLSMGIIVIALAMVASVLFGNFTFDYVRSDLITSNKLQEAKIGYRVKSLLDQLIGGTSPDKKIAEAQIRSFVSRADQIMFTLEDTENLKGGSATFEMTQKLKETSDYWQNTLRPMILQSIFSMERPSLRPNWHNFNEVVRTYTEMIIENERLINRSAMDQVNKTRKLQTALSFVALGMILLMLWMIQDISKRSRELAVISDRIADGQLNIHAPVAGVDELSHLGASFNGMTAKLAGMIESERNDKLYLQKVIATIRETAEALAESASELRDGAAKQAQGMKGQSAEISKTVDSVHKIQAKTNDANKTAEAVVQSSGRAKEVSEVGRKAIDESVEAMTSVKTTSNAIVDGIRSLKNDSKAIEEIVAVVNDIADKTNMLALNASIEASRAGEQGRGFTVVATEIRALAEQSKSTTSQVRRILSKISKRTQDAVYLTSQGKETVERALVLVEQAGDTIRTLEDIIAESVDLASKISVTSQTQTSGINQIRQAITHISEVSDQNLVATRQNEEMAVKLSSMGNRLKNLTAVTPEQQA